MQFQDIERVSNLDKKSFEENYLTQGKPIIITDLSKDWAAREKWTLEFFNKNYGYLSVPVYSQNYSKPGSNYMSPDKKLPLSEFIETIKAGPTDLRMFLFNIFKHAPKLMEDFSIPTITTGFFDSYPMTFFGGKGSITNLHYDIDYPDLFLTQFVGRKRIVLFAPKQSTNLYRHPFTVKSLIDVNTPDYERFPALKNVKGLDCTLQPGETLYMPRAYWHYIEYIDAGFSMTLRANKSTWNRVKGFSNIMLHYTVDKGLNKILGQKWHRYKEQLADRRANKRLHT